MKKALILTDGKAGHENQSRAFVRALGLEGVIVPVKFGSPLRKALSYLLDNVGVLSLGLVEMNLPASGADGVAAVVGTGSGTFYAAKALARRLGVKCGVVLYPRGYRLSGFDCVIAPSFDNPAKKPFVVEVPANLVASDDEFYEKGAQAFLERYSGPVDGLVGVIVGGPNKCSMMSADWMKARLDEIFAANPGAQMCVTTSRRTPADVEAVVDSYPWAYKLIYSRDRFNPIPAFVKLAKRLYVTAESTGMLSEACTSGTAEVRALDNLNPGPHKFRRFLDSLAEAGYVGGNRKIDLSGQFAAARRLMGLA